MMKTVTNEGQFASMIRQEGTTLVDFVTKWCPPCKVLEPILDELAVQYGERLTVLRIDCDEAPEIVSEYGIMSTPTVILFHDGEPVEKLVGLRPKHIYETLLTRYAQ